MKFSLNIFDSLFGEKVEIEIPHDGKIIKQTVTKKWFEKMKSEGKFSELVTAYILDPMNGVYTEGWEVGVNLSKESFEKFKGCDNEIYIINVYEEGNLKKLIVTKEVWEDAKVKMEFA